MNLFFLTLCLAVGVYSSSALGETMYVIKSLKINEVACSKKADGSFKGVVELRGELPSKDSFAAAVSDDSVEMVVVSSSLCNLLQTNIGREELFIIRKTSVSLQSEISYALKALMGSHKVWFNETSI